VVVVVLWLSWCSVWLCCVWLCWV